MQKSGVCICLGTGPKDGFKVNNRVGSMQNKVGIIGLGYVGLPLAITAAEQNWKVYGYDIDVNLTSNLNLGISHLSEISNEQISLVLENGNFRAIIDVDDLSEID